MATARSTSEVHEFHTYFSRRWGLLWVYGFRSLALFLPVLFHVFIALSQDASLLLYCLAFVLDGIALVALREHLRASTRYVCDPEGIFQFSHNKEIYLSWREIDDMRVHFSFFDNGNALSLIPRSGERMCIRLKYLEKGGRSLVEILYRALPDLFAAKASKCFVREEGAAAQDQANEWNDLMLDDRHLHLIRTLGGRETIPLSKLRRVEWLPERISGSAYGHLVIDHADGRIKLFDDNKNLIFFLYALKYELGLENIVNPGPLEETELDRLRTSAGRRHSSLLLGSVLLVAGVIFSCFIIPELSQYEYIQANGDRTEATIIQKVAPRSLRLEYRTRDREPIENELVVTPDCFASVEAGECMEIRVHPKFPGLVAFDGFDVKRHKTIMFLLAGAGAILTLVALLMVAIPAFTLKPLKRRIREFEKAA